MEELIKQAEQGDAEAQFHLGLAYYQGNGIEESHEKAFEWWMKAAEQEVPGAMRNLGIMYRDGDGVVQDLFNAMYWFGKAYRYGIKEVKNEMNDIRLWIVKECGNTVPEDTSASYASHIERFIKEKGEEVDRFIADCKERKNYKPETYTEFTPGNESLVIYLNIYSAPASVREKGFKEYLLSELLAVQSDRLWRTNNREWAYACLDASIEVVKDLSEPWVPHVWMAYYGRKAYFYMQENKWEKAETAYRDILAYRSICYMSQFAMDDENIYEEMSQNELDDFCNSEWVCYDRYVSLMDCLVLQDNIEEAQSVFAEFYSILENRIKRNDSYVIDDWILNEWKNENNPEAQISFIRILKRFGIAHVWAFCLLYCGKLEKEMNENGVGNGYQWSREQYECVEWMFSSALTYVEQVPDGDSRYSVLTLLTIYKGEYLMQTRRFVLAEKQILQGLEMIKNILDEDRTEENVKLLAEIIGLFDDLYCAQNQKNEKHDFLLSLMDLFTENERQEEYYLTLSKKLGMEA